MHYTAITSLGMAFLMGTATALQVNWYSDRNCGSYKDSTYFSGVGIHGNDGSAGSALFVTTDGCAIYGCETATGPCTKTKVGQCISYPDGTYVSSDC